MLGSSFCRNPVGNLQNEDPVYKLLRTSLPLRWLFYDFTENINTKLNVSMFYLRFSTIFIQGLRFVDCLLGFYKTKMVFVLRFVGLRS